MYVEPRILNQDTDQLITPSVERLGVHQNGVFSVVVAPYLFFVTIDLNMRKVDGEWIVQCHENCNKKLSLESYRHIISEMSSHETTFFGILGQSSGAIALQKKFLCTVVSPKKER